MPSRYAVAPGREEPPRPERAAASGASGDRLQDVEAEEGALGHRDHDRTVGLLVVLQDGDEPARRAERAVECRHRARARAARVALPGVQPARLVRGAVRGRRELAVLALRRHPRLAVELAGCRATEIAGRGVDDAVGHLDLGQHLALPPEQALVLGLGVLGTAVAEHLDLVELVDADDAAGVLAVRSGLAAVAGRPAGIPLRALRQVD